MAGMGRGGCRIVFLIMALFFSCRDGFSRGCYRRHIDYGYIPLLFSFSPSLFTRNVRFPFAFFPPCGGRFMIGVDFGKFEGTSQGPEFVCLRFGKMVFVSLMFLFGRLLYVCSVGGFGDCSRGAAGTWVFANTISSLRLELTSDEPGYGMELGLRVGEWDGYDNVHDTMGIGAGLLMRCTVLLCIQHCIGISC